MHLRRPLCLLILLTCLAASSLRGQEKNSAFTIPNEVETLINSHCIGCHDSDDAEGGVRLDLLGKSPLEERLTLLNNMQEQIFFQLMPPVGEDKLSEKGSKKLGGWLSSELSKHNASKLDEKLRRSEFGNYVDHDELFSGKNAHLKGFTFDRRWLISEFIFNAKVNDLLDHQGVRTIDGVSRNVIGDNGVNLGTRFGGHNLRQSITNPFLLPDKVGVRYYDTTALTDGHLLTMLSNAKKIATYMTSEAAMKAHYPAMYRIMKFEFENQRTLNSREKFLNAYIENILEDLYAEEHARLLPKFLRVKVDNIQAPVDSKGKPIPKESNMELLHRRYDAQDIQAIYRGIQAYQKDDVSFDQVIEKCELDWFHFGIHEKRIQGRVSLMKILDQRWDMSLVFKDVSKQNFALPPYKPLSDSEMQIIHAAIRKHRKQGDRYLQIIEKCMSEWSNDFRNQQKGTKQEIERLAQDMVIELFVKILEREPTEQELLEKLALFDNFRETLNHQQAIAKLIETYILSTELVYRSEFGTGQADESGRRMMSPRDASYALAYALTDSSPDEELVDAVKTGKLQTREDYRREIVRMLKRRDQFYVVDESVQKAGFNSSITNAPIRKLRFFREFFGYPKAMSVFKDDARFGAGRFDGTVGRLVDETDMLVNHILEKDQNVFEKLLASDKFYVFHSGDNEAMKAASDRLRIIYDYFKVHDWENFTQEQLYEHWPFIKKMNMRGTVFPDFETNERRKKGWVRSFKTHMSTLEQRLGQGQKAAIPYDAISMAYWHKGNATGRTGQVMRAHEVTTFFNIDFRDWDYPTTQPAKTPNRKGMLTHPAWLIAHSLNLENDPVRRGKWIREKLLAGTIPDVPITVDAVIPEDPHKTLRLRLEKKTSDSYCWQCHQKMDPLGLAFEIYDDFGRFRTAERLEHAENLITPQKQAPRTNGVQLPVYKTLPVDARGKLDSTGDPSLDGNVKDAIDLAERLSKSARVRQSIIRHAFRYFMGRNEMLSDSKTLIDAEQAYLDSGGSFDAVIVSLLTSDSFIYRKARSAPAIP